MYIHELDALIAVADKGSFLQAAKELYLTPASVMNQVNKLERIVGVKLVERTNQGTALTAAGRTLYVDAAKIIAMSRSAIGNARAAAQADLKTIRIGTSLMRPCRSFVDMWEKIEGSGEDFALRIVPFDDSPASFGTVLASLGSEIDCFVSPCDSAEWREQHSILQLSELPCRIALSRRHRLSHRSMLTWEDLHGETFLLRKRGDSPVLDRLRDDIMHNQRDVHIKDVSDKYDTSVFNICDEENCLMETLDIWADVHPSLVTLPMVWNYTMPYGIIYARKASPAVNSFMRRVRTALAS